MKAISQIVYRLGKPQSCIVVIVARIDGAYLSWSCKRE